MINKIDNVVILGGGTSAWMCAAYLSANTENINITLVDKEIGNPVGVGEATLLNFGPFLRSCGFDESQ
jgi:tryptophan halogenase